MTSTDWQLLSGERLDLLPFSVALVDAMLAGDETAAHAATGARFPGGLIPPLLDDHLTDLRAQLLEHPEKPAWNSWLAIDRALGEAVGSAGGGTADGPDTVLIGWAVYPRYEGRGYATEAARLIARWMLRQPGTHIVRATVPVAHSASIRVAEKIGMRHVGESSDPEVGPLLVFEIMGDGNQGAG